MSLSSIHFSSALSPIDSPEPNQSKVQLKPDELQEAINAILTDGIKNQSAKDFMAEQIVELVKENTDSAKVLNIESDFQFVKKNIIEPEFKILDIINPQNKICTAEGYLNFNVSIPFATTGVMLNSCRDSFVYGGIALTTPSFAITISPDTVSEGWNNVFQIGIGFGASIGADSNGLLAREGGLVTKGLSLSKFYVVKIN